MVASANLGFPRIGPRRELKRALEGFWRGRRSAEDLVTVGRSLRRDAWALQRRLGIDQIPSNDFSLYDHVLDTCAMVGAVPSRYRFTGDQVDLETYFAMARGRQGEGGGVPAMEMTKWFDTNYHYIVPELEQGQELRLASTKAVDELAEAKAVGIDPRPVLLGPVSFLLLAKSTTPGLEPLSLVSPLVGVYAEVLQRLAQGGATWVQLDEPCLVLDLPAGARRAYEAAYGVLRQASPGLKLLVATYFGDLEDNLPWALELPVDGLHLDLVRAPGQLETALAQAPDSLTLSLGLVDGRNVWRSDLARLQALVAHAASAVGTERVQVAPSCSLLHVPLDLGLEERLDPELREWLAFGRQRLEEVAILAQSGRERDGAPSAAEAIEASREGAPSAAEAIEASREAHQRRRSSTRVHDEAVARRAAAVDDTMARRGSAYPERHRVQQARLTLPVFPTTTIGSFPQTPMVRKARAEHRAGTLSTARYEEFLEGEIASCLRFQEEAGLDVLVHGEVERSDMVEYFAHQLLGFAVTDHGWVQSFGSRYVKPPLIYGDVSRPAPMTVRWSRYAQSLTERPVKGMLTGPVTLLQWSFVRDDQPRSDTALQLALAIRDEVQDLEGAGIGVIQIDEPALREGLPLREAGWADYLEWAVRSFKVASSGVRNETQIHTHMCYAEFNDIIEAVGAMDADAISIESSRSRMELLGAFARYHYPNGVGPGVYDIHSPRIPPEAEMRELLEKALKVVPEAQLWVNPDCGLKTRRWEEVDAALRAMVAAARELRARRS